SSTTGSFGLLLNVPAAKVQFATGLYSISETTSSLTITITRTAGSVGTVTVNYATSDGTAKAGTNYQATSGSLLWNDGDTASKSFTVPILDAGTLNGNLTFNLTLSSPGGSASLGSPATAIVQVLNAHFRTDKLLAQDQQTGQWWL